MVLPAYTAQNAETSIYWLFVRRTGWPSVEAATGGGNMASTKSRICSSCMTKHMLEFQMFFTEHIAQKVPHRHFVFTMPKILRRYFIMNRDSLNDLSRMTWESLKEFMAETLNINGISAAVHEIQTH